MNLSIDVSPQLGAQLFAAAHLHRLAPSDVIVKVLTGDLPPLQVQKDSDAEPAQNIQAPTISPKNAAAIALLQTWAQEDATDDPEAIREAEADVDEFLQNLNRNRIDSGERPLLP